MSEPSQLLEVRDVAKRFELGGGIEARPRSASGAGEVHALMGANGAGKSTLVKILTGVFPPTAGSVSLTAWPVVSARPPRRARAGIVSVYQDPALVPDLTIAQNMRLAEADPARRRWLARTNSASSSLDFSAFVRDLPYPILRLIDLARALASEPKMLLLDEITAALPADLSERVFAMVRRWRERGNAVLFISHRMAEVAALCDRATVLRDGVTVGVTEAARGSEDRIVSLMLGAEVAKIGRPGAAQARAGAIASAGAPALEVQQPDAAATCCRTYHSACAPGEVLGVAALEGQGQEELFDCIAGVRRHDAGAVFAQGRPLQLRHPADAIAAGLVLVPANRLQALLQQRSIRENVALPAFRGLRDLGADRHGRGDVAAWSTR